MRPRAVEGEERLVALLGSRLTKRLVRHQKSLSVTGSSRADLQDEDSAKITDPRSEEGRRPDHCPSPTAGLNTLQRARKCI
ncbi:hypothetical protein NQZ68_017163 [Dissostichus eleginoides]|nr:hypothetical protein NQZ68_017163 [Dissostichus eleginoides]